MGGPAQGEGVGRPGRCWARAGAGAAAGARRGRGALSPAWAGVSAAPELGGAALGTRPGQPAFGPLFGKARKRLWVQGNNSHVDTVMSLAPHLQFQRPLVPAPSAANPPRPLFSLHPVLF